MDYGSISQQQVASSFPPMSEQQRASNIQLLRNNVKGWYIYCFSSEPFIVSAVSTYIPLLLEQYARINGVKVKNHSKACSGSDDQCVLPLFNGRLFVDTSSFPLYTFSLSVLVQTFIVITVSGIVDRWNSVKLKGNILVLFSIIGSISTMLISQLNVSQIYSLPILYIIANSCFGVINVVGNSLLPTFVNGMMYMKENGEETLSQENLTNLISGRGASLGYLSALLVQIISMFLVNNSKSKQDIQVAIAFVGVWWIIWQLPMVWLFQDVSFMQQRNLPITATATGSVAPTTNTQSIYANRISRRQFNWKLFTYGWVSLWESLKHARLLKDVMIFLLSWFIISDSTTTINSTAILFSKTELNMSTLNLITISILTMINAMIGAFVIPQFLSKKLNLLPKRIMICIICWTCVIPFYGILGFIFKNFGLKHKFEMFILAIWYGLSLGGLAAVSRSVFSLIIPRGKESTFFSLFSITDKGSSILGPFLIGLITDRTHNIRYAFYLLFFLLVLSLPFLEMLDLDRGKREAEELSSLESGDDEIRLE
ncbi:autophagy-related protein 22 [Monosporozyma servazzii]